MVLQLVLNSHTLLQNVDDGPESAAPDITAENLSVDSIEDFGASFAMALNDMHFDDVSVVKEPSFNHPKSKAEAEASSFQFDRPPKNNSDKQAPLSPVDYEYGYAAPDSHVHTETDYGYEECVPDISSKNHNELDYECALEDDSSSNYQRPARSDRSISRRRSGDDKKSAGLVHKRILQRRSRSIGYPSEMGDEKGYSRQHSRSRSGSRRRRSLSTSNHSVSAKKDRHVTEGPTTEAKTNKEAEIDYGYEDCAPDISSNKKQNDLDYECAIVYSPSDDAGRNRSDRSIGRRRSGDHKKSAGLVHRRIMQRRSRSIGYPSEMGDEKGYSRQHSRSRSGSRRRRSLSTSNHSVSSKKGQPFHEGTNSDVPRDSEAKTSFDREQRSHETGIVHRRIMQRRSMGSFYEAQRDGALENVSSNGQSRRNMVGTRVSSNTHLVKSENDLAGVLLKRKPPLRSRSMGFANENTSWCGPPPRRDSNGEIDEPKRPRRRNSANHNTVDKNEGLRKLFAGDNIKHAKHELAAKHAKLKQLRLLDATRSFSPPNDQSTPLRKECQQL